MSQAFLTCAIARLLDPAEQADYFAEFQVLVGRLRHPEGPLIA